MLVNIMDAHEVTPTEDGSAHPGESLQNPLSWCVRQYFFDCRQLWSHLKSSFLLMRYTIGSKAPLLTLEEMLPRGR